MEKSKVYTLLVIMLLFGICIGVPLGQSNIINIIGYWTRDVDDGILYTTTDGDNVQINGTLSLDNNSLLWAILSGYAGDNISWDAVDMEFDVSADGTSKWNDIGGITLFTKTNAINVQLNDTLTTLDNITMEGNRTINATRNLTIGNEGDIILCLNTLRDMYPYTDLMVNLGKPLNRFNNLSLGGDANISGNLSVGDNITLENDMVISNSVADRISFTGVHTGSSEILAFEIDYDDSSVGPTLYGSSTLGAGRNVLRFGSEVRLPDGIFFVFGTSLDAFFNWHTEGNDFFLLRMSLDETASRSGFFTIANTLNKPTFAHPIVADPHLRIYASTTDVDEYIQFWHDATDGNIDVGAGNLNLPDVKVDTLGINTAPPTATGRLTEAFLSANNAGTETTHQYESVFSGSTGDKTTLKLNAKIFDGSSGVVRALSANAFKTGAGDASGATLEAMFGFAYTTPQASGDMGTLRGLNYLVQQGGIGDVALGEAIQVRVDNVNTGTMATARGMLIKSATNTGGGAITDVEGLRMEEQTVGSSTNYEMFFEGAGEIFWRDAMIHVGSLDDGHLDLTADVSIDLNSDTNVTGKLNVTDNSTFFDNVTIHGTLFGGSPVKIAGIDITDNLFSHIEDRNSSVRFTLQNLNNSMNASSVISARNDVDGSMSVGIGSSGFYVGATPYPNITALFSRARGEMVFANFYNNPFVWFYNPQDDNDAANLVEIMRLDEDGLNISGNFTGNQFYAEMWFHNNTDGTITEIATQNVWYNMTFTPSEDSGQRLNGFTYALVGGTGVLTCQVAGLYSIDYKVSCGHAGGGSEEYQWQIYVSDEEQNNTDAHRKISTGGDVGSASGGGFIALIAGDAVYLQVTNRDGTRDLETHALNVNLIRIGD